MSQASLSSYLNDHLAGSTIAIELLNHLQETPGPMQSTLRRVREEVLIDRQELERLMVRLNIAQSTPRRLMAWVSEKVAHVKFWFDDFSGRELRLLEALEIISLGIEGKKALWRSLSTVADAGCAPLRAADIGRLIGRAEEQRKEIETLRIDAARIALRQP